MYMYIYICIYNTDFLPRTYIYIYICMYILPFYFVLCYICCCMCCGVLHVSHMCCMFLFYSVLSCMCYACPICPTHSFARQRAQHLYSKPPTPVPHNTPLPHNLHLTTSISRVPSTRLLHDMSRGGERHGVGSDFFHPLSIFSASSTLSCIPLCISLFHTYIHAHTHTHAHAHTHTLSLSHANTHTHTRTCITMETCIYKCDGPDGVSAHVKSCLCTRQNALHLPSPCIFHLEVHTPSPAVVAVCDALHLL